MAIITEEELTRSSTPGIAETKVAGPVETPTFAETFKAAFAQDNIFSNLFREATDIDADTSGTAINFNPFEDEGIKITGYEEFADRFIGSNSDADINIIKSDIDYEVEQRNILARSNTWPKLASLLAANALDPTLLIPVVGAIKAARVTGKVIQGALSGAVLTGAGEVGREAILQSTQEIRTKEESLINIGAATVLGGALGGVVGGLRKSTRSLMTSDLSKSFGSDESRLVVDPDNLSLSAAETASTLEREGLANINETTAKIAGGVVEGLRSPSLRGVTSTSSTVREFTNKTLDHNFILKKELEGEARGDVAEDLIRVREKSIEKTLEKTNKLYLKHAGVGELRASIPGLRPKDKLSRLDFNLRVARVVRDSSIKDSLDEVNQAAALYKTDLNKTLKEFQEAGIISKEINPKVATNYLTRSYNRDKIVTGRDKFRRILSTYMRDHDETGALRKIPLEKAKADELAEDSISTILKESDKQITLSNVVDNALSKGNFTKNRVLLVNDNEIEEFLVNDIEQLFSSYQRKAAGLIETDKVIKGLGFEDFGELKQQLVLDKDKLLRLATSDKEKLKIDKDFKNNLELTEDIYRTMTNQIKSFKGTNLEAGLQYLMDFQYMGLLGGVTLSSIPEVGTLIFRTGFKNIAKEIGSQIWNSGKGLKSLKRQQLNDIGVSIKLAKNEILKKLTNEEFLLNTGRSTGRQVVDTVKQVFTKATLIEPWTNMLRGMASDTASSSILRLISKKSLTSAEIRKLTSMGIGKAEVPILKAQLKHVGKIEGGFISNAPSWTSDSARNIFRRAIQKEIESSVLLPGKGDIPFFVQKNSWGRVLFQFKSFMSAATNKILISGIQRRDSAVMQGVMAMIILGGISGQIKGIVAGKEITDDLDEFIVDGISRSGVIGLVGNAALDSGRLLGDDSRKRYFGQSIQSTLLGPSVGFLTEDLPTVAGKVISGDKFTRQDKRTLKRMIPFNNLFYLSRSLEEVFGIK